MAGRTGVTASGIPNAKRIMARLQADAGESLQARGRQLISYARLRWPKRSRKYKYRRPHSRDLFRLEYRVDGEILTLVVHNDARDGWNGRGDLNYIYFIRSWKNGLGGKNIWQELIRKPAKKANAAFIRSVTKAAVEAFRG
jgi:hypothetical protein